VLWVIVILGPRGRTIIRVTIFVTIVQLHVPIVRVPDLGVTIFAPTVIAAIITTIIAAIIATIISR